MDTVNFAVKTPGKFLSTVSLTVNMPAGLLSHNTGQCAPEFLAITFILSDLSSPVFLVLVFLQRPHFL